MNELNKLTVIVPAYNEAASLDQFLAQVMEYCHQRQWNLIVVNDGSTDATKTILQSLPHTTWMEVLHHKLNRGYGAAIKTGLAAVQTEYAITFDADGQHALADIEKLLLLIVERDADLVVGSRKSSGSCSWYRGIGKFIIRNLAKILMTVPIYDLNSGMKIYRTDLVKNYLHLAPDTMAFSDIIALVFINNRHLVLETPIEARERKHGKSKIGIESAFHTIMEIINIVVLFSPMKIFLPLSLISFIVSAVWGIPLLVAGRGLSTGSLLGIVTGLIFFLLGLITEQLSQIRRNPA